jgi:hypothetical protein
MPFGDGRVSIEDQILALKCSRMRAAFPLAVS